MIEYFDEARITTSLGYWGFGTVIWLSFEKGNSVINVENFDTRFAKDTTLMRLIERGISPVEGSTDILLIFPPTSIASRYGKKKLGKLGGDLIPLGIASIAAFLREHGYGVGVLDCCALGLNQTDIVSICF